MNQTTGSLWVVYALLSTLFAALTSILAKIGINGDRFQPCNCDQNSGCSGEWLGVGFMSGVQKQISNIGHVPGCFWFYPELQPDCPGYFITGHCRWEMQAGLYRLTNPAW